jgi:methylenetetrahydrofolate dehydrogenase (NADP+)/methenyltetrahydrofolate cyclohydrolase
MDRVEGFRKKSGRKPGLAVVLVGEDPASHIYIQKKTLLASELGMNAETIHYPSTTSAKEVHSKIEELNLRNDIDGILIQRPLPQGFDESKVIHWVAPEKDVDAFHPYHVAALTLGLAGFVPCTPLGILELLRFYQISFRGKIACVVGRSALVGKPMASLLLREDATVIHCHSKTRDLKAMTRQADLLIVAAGSQGLIQPEHIKEGAVVVDVGIHRTVDGKVTGDVETLNVMTGASPQAITPVPGGVGPMTVLMLMSNTLEAAERRLEGRMFDR